MQIICKIPHFHLVNQKKSCNFAPDFDFQANGCLQAGVS